MPLPLGLAAARLAAAGARIVASSAALNNPFSVERGNVAPQVDVSVLGDKALERQLAALPPKVQKAAARTAFRKAARIVRRDAINRAPRDTGQLANSIRIRANKGRKQIGVRVVTGFRLPDGRASFTELGTRYQEGQRYLRDALDSNREAILARLATDFRDAIDDVVRRAELRASVAERAAIKG